MANNVSTVMMAQSQTAREGERDRLRLSSMVLLEPEKEQLKKTESFFDNNCSSPDKHRRKIVPTHSIAEQTDNPEFLPGEADLHSSTSPAPWTVSGDSHWQAGSFPSAQVSNHNTGGRTCAPSWQHKEHTLPLPKQHQGQSREVNSKSDQSHQIKRKCPGFNCKSFSIPRSRKIQLNKIE